MVSIVRNPTTAKKDFCCCCFFVEINGSNVVRFRNLQISLVKWCCSNGGFDGGHVNDHAGLLIIETNTQQY